MNNNTISNALTIDVEDYFQVSAFAPYIARSSWKDCECRVEENVNKILEILSCHEVKATFFTLGWIAERYPKLVKDIVSEGHELASHGYGHERASDLSEKEFFIDIDSSKKILEDISGVQVIGYRAPSFSIGAGNFWAFECLERAGYRYSSSIYPIKHDHYGMPNFSRYPVQISDNFLEIPITTVQFFNRNLPSSGGGYFRLFPYSLSKWLLNQINNKENNPAIFYFHPWEIDINQPRVMGINRKTKFRHYVNIHKMEDRLNKLLNDFHWNRMDYVFLNKKYNDIYSV
nr:XrtA system polysaccharide deacetylase [uncultured Albidiferax sp.]